MRVQRPRRATIAVVVGVVGALTLAACDTGDGKTLREPTASAPPPTVAPDATLNSAPLEPAPEGSTTLVPTTPQEFEVFAPWLDGAPIDVRYSCDGDDVAPPVSWLSPPAGTAELAIAMVDESALDGDRPFTHWVIAGIDPGSISLLEDDVPLGAVQATNSFGTVGYRGPCPPVGDDAHVYRLTLYALNQQSELADGTPATELLDFVEDVAIGAVDLTGTYRR